MRPCHGRWKRCYYGRKLRAQEHRCGGGRHAARCGSGLVLGQPGALAEVGLFSIVKRSSAEGGATSGSLGTARAVPCMERPGWCVQARMRGERSQLARQRQQGSRGVRPVEGGLFIAWHG